MSEAPAQSVSTPSKEKRKSEPAAQTAKETKDKRKSEPAAQTPKDTQKAAKKRKHDNATEDVLALVAAVGKSKKPDGLDDQPQPEEAARNAMKAFKRMIDTIKSGAPQQMAAQSCQLSLLCLMKDLFTAGASYGARKTKAGQRF